MNAVLLKEKEFNLAKSDKYRSYMLSIEQQSPIWKNSGQNWRNEKDAQKKADQVLLSERKEVFDGKNKTNNIHLNSIARN